MSMSIVAGLLIPFLGTTAGAACVFFLKNRLAATFREYLPDLLPVSWWQLRCGLY